MDMVIEICMPSYMEKVIRLSPEYSMKNVSSANGIHASEILSQPLDCHHLVDAISLSLNFEVFSA
jgi:hypothetical protein